MTITTKRERREGWRVFESMSAAQQHRDYSAHSQTVIHWLTARGARAGCLPDQHSAEQQQPCSQLCLHQHAPCRAEPMQNCPVPLQESLANQNGPRREEQEERGRWERHPNGLWVSSQVRSQRGSRVEWC